MTVLSLCYLCGLPAGVTCKMCGKPVCSEHYVAKLELCVKCAGKLHSQRLIYRRLKVEIPHSTSATPLKNTVSRNHNQS